MSETVFLVTHEVPLMVRAMLVALVEAIPDELKVVFGTLVRRDVLSYDKYPTEWVFGNCISRTIRSADQSKLGIFDMLVGKQDPSAVTFGDGAFGYCEVLPVPEIKRFIIHFLQKEYWGRLTFAEYHDNDWGLSCTIVVPPPNKPLIPTLKIDGLERLDQSHVLAPVLLLRHKLGLQERRLPVAK